MKKLIAAALTGALVLGTVGTSVVFAADDDKTRLTPPGCIKADGEHIFHIPIKCRRYKTDISHLCPQPL